MSKIGSAAVEPASAASERTNNIEMPIGCCRGSRLPSLAERRSTEARNAARLTREAPKALLRRA
jgi:hypothetical protein